MFVYRLGREHTDALPTAKDTGDVLEISAHRVSAQREDPGPEVMSMLRARGVLAACRHRSGLVLSYRP